MMLHEKRERKPPKPYTLHTPTPKKDKVLEKKRRLSTCTYEMIPFALKYNHIDETLLLYGNIAVIQRQNQLFTDFSLLNEYHTYHNIEVNQHSKLKTISVSAERRSDVRFARWKSTAKRMIKAKEPALRGWGKTIKTFSLQYENVMNAYWAQIKKIMQEESPEENLNSLKAAVDEKKRHLLEQYPCIQLTSSFKGNENRLSKVTFNEQLLQILGYNIDRFTSLILNEGIPQLLQFESIESSEFLRSILDSWSRLKDPNISTPEFECSLLTRSGYVRNVKIQVHILMNYDTMDHGNDTLFVITQLESLYPPIKSQLTINEHFLQEKIVKEEGISQFLLAYYNFHHIQAFYSNVYKICGIKDLQSYDHNSIES